MEDFAQPILNGILLGGLYAIIAIGMSTMFGIVKLVNLAHGDLMILSSFLCLSFITWFGISPLWTLPIIVPLMYVVGFFVRHPYEARGWSYNIETARTQPDAQGQARRDAVITRVGGWVGLPLLFFASPAGILFRVFGGGLVLRRRGRGWF